MCNSPYIRPSRTARSMWNEQCKLVVNGVDVPFFGSTLNFKKIDYLSGIASIVDEFTGRAYDPVAVHHFIKENYIHTSAGVRIPLYEKWPCGHCSACKDSRRADYERRALLEASCYPYMCFYTLTYRDSCLPENRSLSVRHMQLFHKKLRVRVQRYISQDITIRFLYCGEYSPAPKCRPHYHGIMFFSRQLSPLEFIKLVHLFFHTREFRQDCPRSRNIWPHGYRRDLQFCKNPAKCARYICKYITKSNLQDMPPLPARLSEEPIHEGFSRHFVGWQQSYLRKRPFIMSPRRGGALGSHYYTKDAIDYVKNCKNRKFEILIDGKIQSISIPPQLTDIAFPTPSRLCKDFAFKYSELKEFLLLSHNRLVVLTSSVSSQLEDILSRSRDLQNLTLSNHQKKKLAISMTFFRNFTDTELSLLITQYVKILHPIVILYRELVSARCKWFYDAPEYDPVLAQMKRELRVGNNERYVRANLLPSDKPYNIIFD